MTVNPGPANAIYQNGGSTGTGTIARGQTRPWSLPRRGSTAPSQRSAPIKSQLLILGWYERNTSSELKVRVKCNDDLARDQCALMIDEIFDSSRIQIPANPISRA
jgi:hypothetical protein